MKRIWITGLYDSPIDANYIDFVANPSIDIEKMETADIDGFEFRLPYTEVPLIYDNTGVYVEITKSVEIPSDWKTAGGATQYIYVSDNTNIIIGEVYWIKNELIGVVGKGTDADGDYIIVKRGQKGTFPNAYYRDTESQNYYYVTTTPQTFVGIRVILYEDDDIISIGTIEKNPEYQNGILDFSCSDLLKSLDVDFPALNDSQPAFREGLYPIYYALKLFYDPTVYKTEVPPIADYFNMNVHPRKLLQYVNRSVGFKRDKFSSISDFIDFFSKANLMVLSFNQAESYYTFTALSQSLSLETIASVSLSAYKDISKAASSKTYNGISQVRVKTEENTFIFTNNLSQAFYRNSIELDFSGFSPAIDFSAIRQIGIRYIEQFGFIYSMLEIPSHPFKFKDFEVGKTYDITDIEKFYTYQNDSSKAFCIGKDNKTIKFLIIKEGIRSPICPGIPVTATSNVLTFGWSGYDFEIQDFLQCVPDSDLETAALVEFNFNYFEADDFISLQGWASGVKTSGKITSVSGGNINTNISVTDGDYWLFWDNYSVVNTRQQQFFFLNQNNW